MTIEYWHELTDDDNRMWPVRVEAECSHADGVIDWHVYAEADGAEVVINDRLTERETREIQTAVEWQWASERADLVQSEESTHDHIYR